MSAYDNDQRVRRIGARYQVVACNCPYIVVEERRGWTIRYAQTGRLAYEVDGPAATGYTTADAAICRLIGDPQ